MQNSPAQLITKSASIKVAASPQLQRQSIAATEDLREAVRRGLGNLFVKFIGRMSTALSAKTVDASDTAGKYSYQQLSRFALAATENWTESYIQSVDTHLLNGLQPGLDASMDQATDSDDSASLVNIELSAESRYKKLVVELDSRINRLRLMLYVPVYTKALAPTGLCRALRDTAASINWPANHRRLLLEQFDSIFISELEPFYQLLIQALMQITADAEKTAAKAHSQDSTPAPRPKKWAHEMTPPPDQKTVDPETMSMLESAALQQEGAGYTNALLAADLHALTDDRPLPGLTQDQNWIPLQRMTLAGHFLNEAITDPMLPDGMASQNESVRYPLLKSALTDETLFTTANHPLGSMLHEILLKSATSRVTGDAQARRMADLLQELIVKFDFSPDFVRQTLTSAEPIQETQVERFFELQRQQAQQRRNFVIQEAKRVVANQLERATLGRDTPAPALHFLNTAWGPLLTKRLLQHGAGHALSKAGLELMEQMQDQLDTRDPSAPLTQEWKELMLTMGKALLAEGMADTVNKALTSLEQAFATPLKTE